MNEVERKVVVTDHAVFAYIARNGTPLAGSKRSELSDRDLNLFRRMRFEIHECVRQAIAEGRILNHKPDGFVLYRQKRRQLPDGQRFVYCDESTGFIVKRLPGGEDIVVTTLTKVGVAR